MAKTHTIKLHVSANNAAVGVLNVKVTPWRVHLDDGDTVQWTLDHAATLPHNDIEWFRVEQAERVDKWPFSVQPPDTSYTAIKNAAGGATVTSPAKGPAGALGPVSYGLTIGFKDDAGDLRTMYIDPDLVVDS